MTHDYAARSRALIAPALCDLDDESRTLEARARVENAYRLPHSKRDARARNAARMLRAREARTLARYDAALASLIHDAGLRVEDDAA